MVVMPCTFRFRPSMILDLLWFRCGPSADDASPMKVSWWKHLWKASWMHLNSKYVAFGRLVVSCVGLSFGWICICLAVGAWMICICYFDVFVLVNMIEACVVWCIAFVRSNIEFRKRLADWIWQWLIIYYLHSFACLTSWIYAIAVLLLTHILLE